MIAVPVAELLDREMARHGITVEVGDLAEHRAKPVEWRLVIIARCHLVLDEIEAWTTTPPHAGGNCAWCGAALQPGEPEVCTDCLGRGLPHGSRKLETVR